MFFMKVILIYVVYHLSHNIFRLRRTRASRANSGIQRISKVIQICISFFMFQVTCGPTMGIVAERNCTGTFHCYIFVALFLNFVIILIHRYSCYVKAITNLMIKLLSDFSISSVYFKYVFLLLIYPLHY